MIPTRMPSLHRPFLRTVALCTVLLAVGGACAADTPPAASTPPAVKPETAAKLPRLVDLGADKCIPCKKMAPILEALAKDFKGQLDVEFIDVWKKPETAVPYGIEQIPTQIFYDAAGKERFRHVGFFGREEILAKWKELGYDFSSPAPAAAKIERWEPAAKDARAKDAICSLSDNDIDPQNLVVVKSDKGDVRLRDLHHYFILYSCLTEDKSGFEKRVSVTDTASGKLIPAVDAAYLAGVEEKTGRPWIKAFASRDAATKAMPTTGGSLISWNALQANELSHRCGFCDRAMYPQDGATVLIDGVHSYGCCAHCAMGVAARTGKDIEVRQPDGLTGEIITVKTSAGTIASVEPKTAVAWFGKKKAADGKWVSAGCFHQGFFVTPQNLQKWLELHPLETGEMITIQQSLADKMKLSPQQIQKACKIGECAPKP